MTELQGLISDTKRILFYLDNDSRTGKKGLVTDVEDLKTEVEGLRTALTNFIAEYRQAQAIKKAKIGIIGAIAGALASFAGWIISHLIK